MMYNELNMGGDILSTTKAQQNAVNKYIKNNYDSLRIVVPKGRKATVEALAAERQDSVNGLVNRLLRAEAGLSEQEWKNPEQKQE